jgi:hypothetical protein
MTEQLVSKAELEHILNGENHSNSKYSKMAADLHEARTCIRLLLDSVDSGVRWGAAVLPQNIIERAKEAVK